MRCNTCGTENPENSIFCQKCASRFDGAIQVTKEQAKRKSSTRTVIIAIVIAVAIVLLIAVVAAFAFMRAVDDASTTDATMTVLDAAEVVDPFWSAQSGYRFVQLTIEMVNGEDEALLLSVFEFSVMTANGTSYGTTLLVDDTIPASIAAGQTVTFTLAFSIPVDDTPVKLTYEEMFSTNVIEASIGTVSPPEYKLTLSVVSADDVMDAEWSPSEGYRYVEIAATMTNEYEEAISLSPYDFQIETSGGSLYDYTWAIDDTVPDGLAAGATTTFTIAFEIPESETPETLIYACTGFTIEAQA